MTTLTAAQQARQQARHGDGRYAEMLHPDPGQVVDDVPAAVTADDVVAQVVADRQVAWVRTGAETPGFEVRRFGSPFDAYEYAEHEGFTLPRLNDDGTIDLVSPDGIPAGSVRLHLPRSA